MKKSIFLSLFLLSTSSEANLFECKVSMQGCRKKISFYVKDVYIARKEAFWLFKKDCPTITLKNISCKKITESGSRREKKKKSDSFYGSIFGEQDI